MSAYFLKKYTPHEKGTRFSVWFFIKSRGTKKKKASSQISSPGDRAIGVYEIRNNYIHSEKSAPIIIWCVTEWKKMPGPIIIAATRAQMQPLHYFI